MTQTELNDLLEANPDVGAAGMRTHHWDGEDEDWADNREWLRERLSQVTESVEFLRQCSPTKTFRNSRCSYGLKHDAECSEGRSYICNGALIVAVIHLGLRYRRDGNDDPNIDVAIKVPDHLERQ